MPCWHFYQALNKPVIFPNFIELKITTRCLRWTLCEHLSPSTMCWFLFWDPQVHSLDPQVKPWDPWVHSRDSWVHSRDPWVHSMNPLVHSRDPWICGSTLYGWHGSGLVGLGMSRWGWLWLVQAGRIWVRLFEDGRVWEILVGSLGKVGWGWARLV